MLYTLQYLLDNSVRDDNTGCLIFRRSAMTGAFIFKGGRFTFNKIAYMIHHNLDTLPRSDDYGNAYIVTQTCGNDRCVSKEHLQFGPRAKFRYINGKWNDDAMTKLMKRANINEETGCYEWLGSVVHGGYGSVTVNGAVITTHRLSYMIKENVNTIPSYNENGIILQVRHLCGNPPCFNPNHLTLGTIDENMYEDKVATGTLTRGSKAKNSKITEELARQILSMKKKRFTEGYKSITQIAQELNVPVSVVVGIHSGTTWRHLSEDSGDFVRNIDNRYVLTEVQVNEIKGKLDSGRSMKSLEREYKVADNVIKRVKEGKYQLFSERSTTPDTVRLEQKDKRRAYNKPKNTQLSEEQYDFIKEKLDTMKVVDDENNEFMDSPCHTIGREINSMYYTAGFFGIKKGIHIWAIESDIQRPVVAKEEIVRHLCGNRYCFRLDHLQIGNQSENAIDAIRHGTHKTKLTGSQVQQIRNEYSSGNATYKTLGEKYGVSASSIRYIIIQKTWTHV